MRNKLVKLIVISAFSAFAACAFFVSQESVSAGEGDIFTAIADYKNWKQVNKPTEALKQIRAGQNLTLITVSDVAG